MYGYISPFLCRCSATLSTSGATGGRGGVVMSMWFLVGMDRRHGIGWTVPIWLPFPSASWLPEEAVDEPSAYRAMGKRENGFMSHCLSRRDTMNIFTIKAEGALTHSHLDRGNGCPHVLVLGDGNLEDCSSSLGAPVGLTVAFCVC